MAINPFQIRDLQIPANPRPVPLDFGFLSDIGAGIGAYRERQALGDILASARDAQGNLDINKAATALAVSGRTREARELLDTAVRSQAQTELARHYKESEAIQRTAAERPQYSVVPPVPADLLTPERPGGVIELPRVPGQPPKVYPYPIPQPAAPVPAPATPGPGSSAGDVLPAPAPTAAISPEEAPPYRVAQAGGAIPPAPSTAPAAAGPPAAAPTAAQRNETYLRTLPTDAARTLVKGVADYEIDPGTLPGDLRAKILVAAKNYRPDFIESGYQKRPTVSGEMAGRLGMASKFELELRDRKDAEGNTVPGILSRIERGELNRDWPTALQAQFYKGGPGEVRRMIEDGAEALTRMLTGAGMNMQEVADRVNRYTFRIIDSPQESAAKVKDLARVLKATRAAVESGKFSPEQLDKLLPAERSTFETPKQSEPILVRSPEEAKQIRKQNPKARLINLQGEIFEP